jgi:hypothetical protein
MISFYHPEICQHKVKSIIATDIYIEPQGFLSEVQGPRFITCQSQQMNGPGLQYPYLTNPIETYN